MFITNYTNHKIKTMFRKNNILRISISAIILLTLTSFNGRYDYSKEFDYHFERNHDLVINTEDIKIWHKKNQELDIRFGKLHYMNQWRDTSLQTSGKKLNAAIKYRMDSIINSIK